MSDVQQNISALLSENRVFDPSEEFRTRAIVQDRTAYERADADPEGFWAEQADQLEWFTRWDSVMDWTPPTVKWFVGGSSTSSVNCLDRHLAARRRRQGRDLLGGRARRGARRSPTGTCTARCAASRTP